MADSCFIWSSHLHIAQHFLIIPDSLYKQITHTFERRQPEWRKWSGKQDPGIKMSSEFHKITALAAHTLESAEVEATKKIMG